MLKSMTGFGRTEYDDEKINIEVEIKSLNSKTTDIRIRNGFLSAENEMQVRNYLTKNLFRGKIDVSFNLKIKNNKGKYSINSEVFEKYFEQLSQLTQNHGKKIDNIDYYTILMRLPDIVETEEFDVSEIWNKMFDVFKKAVENLNNFRIQEGKATADVLNLYINNIEKYLNKVPEYESQRIDTIREKINKAFDESKLKADNERFEAELIFYLEKYDIQEEKTRLANHLEYFKQTMQEELCGKKLGFISQEMGREINTLGSKANHFDIQKLVVQMKDELEKIKEQVLNIL